MTARGELGALCAALALGGVVFAVQQSGETPSTVRGPVGADRAAPPAATAAAFEVAKTPAAPSRAQRHATFARRVARHRRAVSRRRAPVRRVHRVHRAAPVRRAPAVPVVVRPQRPLPAPRPVTLSAPKIAAPRPVVRPAPAPVVRRVAPRPAPRPRPKPKPAPSGVSFVDSG